MQGDLHRRCHEDVRERSAGQSRSVRYLRPLLEPLGAGAGGVAEAVAGAAGVTVGAADAVGFGATRGVTTALCGDGAGAAVGVGARLGSAVGAALALSTTAGVSLAEGGAIEEAGALDADGVAATPPLVSRPK